jgi:hypothetical protein
MPLSDSNVKNMLKAISVGNHVLNETMSFYKNTKTDCPSCGYDPIRHESINPHCPDCNGTGLKETISYVDVPVSVETEDDFRYDYNNKGRLTKGQILVTIDASEIESLLNNPQVFDLNTHNGIQAFISQFDYFSWKGGKYTASSFEAGYLQGYFYELSVTMELNGGL